MIKKSKKLLALLLTVLMIVTAVPMTVLPVSAVTETVSSNFRTAISSNSGRGNDSTITVCSDGQSGSTSACLVKFDISSLSSSFATATLKLKASCCNSPYAAAEALVIPNVKDRNITGTPYASGQVSDIFGSSFATNSTANAEQAYSAFSPAVGGGNITEASAVGSIRMADLTESEKEFSYDITNALNTAKNNGVTTFQVLIMHRISCNDGSGGWSDIYFRNLAETFTIETVDFTDSSVKDLQNVMRSYETKMRSGAFYTNMAAAYNAYVAAQAAIDFACANNDTSKIATAKSNLQSAINNMGTWSAYTGTKQNSLSSSNKVFGDWDNNSAAEYQSIYKNVLYVESSSDGINSNSQAAVSVSNIAFPDSGYTFDIKFFYPTATLLYDGITTPQVGAMFACWGNTKPWNWTWGNVWLYTAYINNTTDIGFADKWYGNDGRLNHTYVMKSQSERDISGTGDTTSMYYNQGTNSEKYYANVIKTNKSYSTSDEIMLSYTPSFSVRGGYNGSNGGNSKLNEIGTGNRAIYVLNYKKVVDTMKSNYSKIRNVASYKYGGLEDVFVGYDNATRDPNSFFTSSNDVSTCRVNYENAVNGMNATPTATASSVTHSDDSYNWTTTVAPGCTTTGTESGECKYCGATTTRELAALGHNYQTVEGSAVTANCTTDGKEADQKCSRCNDVITGATISASGHTNGTPVQENFVDSSCSAEGSYDEVVYCNICNAEISRTEKTVEKKAHTAETDAAKAASCTATGLTEGSHCSVCGETIVAQEVVPMTDHTEVVMDEVPAKCTTVGSTGGTKCLNCGIVLTEPTAVPATGHTPAAAVRENEVAATCENAGSYDEVVYCSECDAELSREAKTIEKKAHTPAEAVVENEVAATCKDEGSYDEVVYCSVCSAEISREAKTIEKLTTHTPAEAVVENKIDATCGADGSYDSVVYCSVCDAKLSSEAKTIPATGEHNYEEVAGSAVEAKCTTDGKEADQKCSVCNDVIIGATIGATGHNYTDVVTQPTCITEGYTTHTCSKCGDVVVDTYVSANGHTAAEAVQENVVDSTCSATGSYNEVVYCSICGEKLSTEAKTIEKKAHTPATAVRENEVAATCKDEGSYDEVVYCSVCSAEISREAKTIAKLTTHTPATAVVENKVEATCSTTGSYDEVVYCSICGEKLSTEAKTIEKKAHTPAEAVRENEVAATCKDEGSYDEVVYCSVCNEKLSSEAKTIDKLTTHTPADAVVENKIDATCGADGSYDSVVYCSVCNAKLSSEAKTIPATGEHNYEEVAGTAVAAACTTDGKEADQKCSVCGAEIAGATIGATGHTEEAIPAVAATCTTSGSTAGVKCSVCQEVITAPTTIGVLGHDWNDGEVTTPASCTATGVMTYTCKNDSTHTKTSAIAVVAHTDGDNDGICDSCGRNICDHATTTVVGYVDSTCENEGYTGDTVCSVCSLPIATGTTIEKKAHTPADAVVENKVDSTCSVTGSYDEVVYCSVCGEKLSTEAKTIEKKAHTEETIPAVDATCTTAGSTAGTKCSICGTIITAPTAIPASGHNYSATVTDATCTTDGYTTHTCSVCGDTYVDNTVSASGHTGGTANCVDKAVCTVCSTAYGDVDSTNHKNVVTDEAVAATCTATGKTEGSHCEACGTIIIAQTTTDKIAHTWGEGVVTTPATCTTTGTMTYTCENCSATKEDTIPTSESSHTNVVTDEAVAPTCTTNGLTEGKHCADCRTTIVAQTTIAKLGHTAGDAVTENEVAATCTNAGSYDTVVYCSVCSAELSRVTTTVEKLAHTEGAAVIENTVAATCSKAGSYETVVYCSVCSTELSRVKTTTAKLAHTEEAIPAVEATCTKAGSTAGVKCSVCGTVITAPTTIPALAHNYEKTSTTAATCTTEGYSTYTCTSCGQTKTADKVAKLPHNTTEVRTEATCTADGSIKTVCSDCGKVVSTETIKATGHTDADEDGICDECGGTISTSKDGWRCDKCDWYDAKMQNSNPLLRFIYTFYHIIYHFIKHIKFITG